MKLGMVFGLGGVLVAGLLSSTARAQEMSVSGNGSSASVLQVTNTSTVATDRVAVSGTSFPAVGCGVGGTFSGGSAGVQGFATNAGTGTQYGGYFVAQHGGTNYAVYARTPGNGYAGYFAGNVFVSGTITQSSDLRLKTDVRDLPAGALPRVLRLRPKTFRYDPATEPTLGLPRDEQVGFVAQDVEQVFPSLVKRTTIPSDDTSNPARTILSVDYMKVVPLLVKALQEQQAQITNLEAEMAGLKAARHHHHPDARP